MFNFVYIKYNGGVIMANKNNAGNRFNNFKVVEKRLVEKIDRREESGKNRENVDSAYNNYSVNKNGAKVWSF